MFTKIPKEWREEVGHNATIEYLNNLLVTLHIPSIVLISILMVIGVFGNILVLYVYTTKYHSSTHRCFILWLGWIDLIACTVGMPLLLVSMFYPYMFPSVEACKIFRCLHVFFVVSSAFIVIAIAIERHRRVCFPFSFEMSTRKIKLMCLLATILGLLVAVPAIIVYGDAVVETGVQNITGKECFIEDGMENSLLPTGYFMFQLLLCVISMVILGIFYFRIARTIWFHHQFIRENTYTRKSYNSEGNKENSSFAKMKEEDEVFNHETNGNSHERSKLKGRLSRESSPGKPLDDVAPHQDPYGDLVKKVKIREKSRSPSPLTPGKNGNKSRLESNRSDKSMAPSLRTKQVTFMLFIITIVFVLSFIPHLTLMVMQTLNPEFIDDLSPTSVALYNIFLRTFVINNMANPIIYGFCDKKFRSACADLLLTVFTCGWYQ